MTWCGVEWGCAEWCGVVLCGVWVGCGGVGWGGVQWGGMGWDQTLVTNETSVFKHCIFEYAYAYNPENILGWNCGGAIRIDDYEQIEISHCLFRNNHADNFSSNNPAGGAIMMNECSIHISHCVFHDNAAPWGGAIAILTNSNPLIDICLFYNNEAISEECGAALVWTDCDPHFVNCTFADNHAPLGGGAAALQLGGTTTFTNCVFWGNTAGYGPSQIDLWVENPPSLNVYYCDVEEGFNGITPGFRGEYIENIDEDPYFTTYGEYNYIPDTLFALTINVGTHNSDYLPEGYVFPDLCLYSNPRIDGGVIDMGCYEYDEWEIGISELSNSDKLMFNISPNPINSNPTIEFYLNNESAVHISILDIHGRIISEMVTQQFQKGTNRLTWNAEKMQTGLYFCQLKIGNKVATTKLVKLK